MNNNISTKKIIDTAASYLVAAIHLEDNMEIEDESKHFFPIEAFITCLSFSLELYLKSLIENPTEIPKTHQLSKLLENIQVSCLSEITGEYGRRTANTELTNEEFIQLAKSFDNVFVEWRYVYENIGNELNVENLKNVIKSVAVVAHSNASNKAIKKDV
ncbi:hypothetical protein [Thiomicrorhabdus arctica]|uniref:hypothetical protein n=1 Tax=Thiomicrorhabdus arctica TaxID=131540 RepID=UPI00036A89C2|nr:hypothetical protein [Thiomicrorhabdus arctica]